MILLYDNKLIYFWYFYVCLWLEDFHVNVFVILRVEDLGEKCWFVECAHRRNRSWQGDKELVVVPPHALKLYRHAEKTSLCTLFYAWIYCRYIITTHLFFLSPLCRNIIFPCAFYVITIIIYYSLILHCIPII